MLVQLGDFGVEGLDAPGQGPQGQLRGLHRVGQLSVIRTQAGAEAGLPRSDLRESRSRSSVGAVTMRSPSWRRAVARALTALRRARRSWRIASTAPSMSFGMAVASPESTLRAAASASTASVLPRRCRTWACGWLTSTTRTPACSEIAGQGGPIAPGRLHAHGRDRCPTAQPRQELPIARRGRRECSLPKPPSGVVQGDRLVDLRVAIHPAYHRGSVARRHAVLLGARTVQTHPDTTTRGHRRAHVPIKPRGVWPTATVAWCAGRSDGSEARHRKRVGSVGGQVPPAHLLHLGCSVEGLCRGG